MVLTTYHGGCQGPWFKLGEILFCILYIYTHSDNLERFFNSDPEFCKLLGTEVGEISHSESMAKWLLSQEAFIEPCVLTSDKFQESTQPLP